MVLVYRRWKFGLYLLLLHLFIAVLILKTDFIPKLRLKLGIDQSVELSTNDFFHLMLTFQRRMDENVPDGTVVFLGDSITQSLAVGAITPRSVNYGIGGLTSKGLLYALPHYHSSLSRSDAIVIAIGVNDFFNGIGPSFDSRFKEIIKRLPQNKPLIVNAIMPTVLPKNTTFTLSDIEKANATIRSECMKRGICTYVDISHVLADPRGQLRRQYYLADGIHLSPAGYREWISHLSQAIKSVPID